MTICRKRHVSHPPGHDVNTFLLRSNAAADCKGHTMRLHCLFSKPVGFVIAGLVVAG